MTVAGEIITAVHLPQRVKVGIEIEPEHEGFVPEYEAREAAVFGNYNYSQWQSLSSWERAAGVAHYRMHLLVESHVNEAVYKYQKAQAAGRS